MKHVYIRVCVVYRIWMLDEQKKVLIRQDDYDTHIYVVFIVYLLLVALLCIIYNLKRLKLHEVSLKQIAFNCFKLVSFKMYHKHFNLSKKVVHIHIL